jgi:FkbM family methyltransferase
MKNKTWRSKFISAFKRLSLVGQIADDKYPIYALQSYPGYTQDDLSILEFFKNPQAIAQSGFVVDFMGGRIRTSSLWQGARALDGQLLAIPVPADFHAEAIEWIGLLKSVKSAQGEFVAMELGAGFGPWVVAGGIAAKRVGISNIRLCAVEGDSVHFRFLKQHFQDNGFIPDQHRLIEAAVGISAGLARWPVLSELEARETWGSRPIDGSSQDIAVTDYVGNKHENTTAIQVVSFNDLLQLEHKWNLVHIDVQGHEFEICNSALIDLTKRVQWIIIGTHSRKIEGDLLALFLGAGWVLEHEKPAKFTYRSNTPTLEAMTTLDGTQVWRNPKH